MQVEALERQGGEGAAVQPPARRPHGSGSYQKVQDKPGMAVDHSMHGWEKSIEDLSSELERPGDWYDEDDSGSDMDPFFAFLAHDSDISWDSYDDEMEGASSEGGMSQGSHGQHRHRHHSSGAGAAGPTAVAAPAPAPTAGAASLLSLLRAAAGRPEHGGAEAGGTGAASRPMSARSTRSRGRGAGQESGSGSEQEEGEGPVGEEDAELEAAWKLLSSALATGRRQKVRRRPPPGEAPKPKTFRQAAAAIRLGMRLGLGGAGDQGPGTMSTVGRLLW